MILLYEILNDIAEAEEIEIIIPAYESFLQATERLETNIDELLILLKQ